MASHVLVGRSKNGADQRIEQLARSGERWGWTVPRVARAGDIAYFYLLNPEGCFVAAGRLITGAVPGTSKEGDGRFVADVGGVQVLPTPIERLQVVEVLPEWGWPRQPHTATTVPSDQEANLARVLGL